MNYALCCGKNCYLQLQSDVRETLWEIQRMNEQLALNQAILTQQMAGLQQLIVLQQNNAATPATNSDVTQDVTLIQINNTDTSSNNEAAGNSCNIGTTQVVNTQATSVRL